MSDTSAWERFRFCASQRLPSGRRSLVVALGAGFNVQAAGKTHELGWSELLRQIARRSGADTIAETLAHRSFVGSTTAVWEALLSDRAGRGDMPAAQAEKWLQDLVAEVLGWSNYPGPVEARAFIDRFAALDFSDLLSFNFDEWLSRPATGPAHRVRGPSSLSLRAPFGKSRLWYPHGHVTRPRTIRLGIRAYGQYVDTIEAAVRDYKQGERLAWEADGDLETWRTARRADAPTWVDATLEAPLVFAGLSLGPEEWPLWSFLTRRLRNAARRPAHERPRTFIFTRRSDGDHEHARLRATAEILGIELLLFDDFSEGWRRFFESFEPRPSRLRPAQVERDVVL